MKISERAERLETLLKEGKTVGELALLGFSPATVQYHRRKLFNPESHRKYLDRIKQQTKKLYELARRNKEV